MYAKVYAKILDSTVARDWFVRHVFMDLIVLADRDGVVDMPIDQIAYRTRGDAAVIARAIEILARAEPESRTQEYEGRRLEAIDDAGYGWKILNYTKYRNLKSSAELAESNRERQRRFKEKRRLGNTVSNGVTPVTDAVTPVTEVTLSDSTQKQDARKPRPGASGALSLYAKLWETKYGVTPHPTAKLCVATNAALKPYDDAEKERIVSAFMDDTDKFIVENKHSLAFLPGRVDRYRAVVKVSARAESNGPPGWSPLL